MLKVIVHIVFALLFLVVSIFWIPTAIPTYLKYKNHAPKSFTKKTIESYKELEKVKVDTLGYFSFLMLYALVSMNKIFSEKPVVEYLPRKKEFSKVEVSALYIVLWCEYFLEGEKSA